MFGLHSVCVSKNCLAVKSKGFRGLGFRGLGLRFLFTIILPTPLEFTLKTLLGGSGGLSK